MNRLFRSFMYVIGALLVYIVLGTFMVPNFNYPQTIDDIGTSISSIERHENDIDIFFIGASHIEDSVSPMQLYEETGLISYNLSTSGQPIDLTLYLIHKLFSIGYKPKLIVLDASSLYVSIKNDASYRYVFDNEKCNLKQLYCKYATIVERQEVLERSPQEIAEQIFEYSIPLYKYHSRWDELDKNSFLKISSNNYFLQGFCCVPFANASYHSLSEIENIAGGIKIKRSQELTNAIDTSKIGTFYICEYANSHENAEYYNAIPNDYAIECLNKIWNICTENDCKLLLVKVPVMHSPAEYPSSWTFEKHSEVKAIAEDIGIAFEDIQFKNIEIDWTHDTSDGGAHLNLLGAEKVTRYLGKYISSNYSIPSRRLELYDNKLFLYHKYVDLVHMALSYDMNDYFDEIHRNMNDKVIIFSVKDDLALGMNDEILKSLDKIGVDECFSKMQYSDSYIAVINDGILEYEKFSDKCITYETQIDNDIFYIKSAGYLNGNVSVININGVEYSNNLRGLNIVIYDKESGMVLDRACLDPSALEVDIKHNNENCLLEYQEYLLGRR